ncbi:DUF4924 family protein [Flammeovirga yaeyamensis]|uniref:DUF4924 family protein n=1 Tax=Flammeovirga yaeyamensis TaxID=367791 RepID=A0AAX1N8Q1_9BACT|nr:MULTISPECIES: DUF4924 family protein [Flammeovirga]ANQ48613.1 DUF4924 family protein [Flammeovirga sp. MY04]MBB3698697.1 hypothetical protein [Flammeovirga yaeyamensis]NMF37284.1 DUF4924 family protein [Flammeovirga yaeyamensis]QWG03898.1 DUF4924 family protein [Flammeovirga yaeyamensis]
MLIAQQKKEQNICEYIIYIYQSEELLRAFDFNFEDIREYVVNHITKLNDKERDEVIQWHKDLLELMKKEEVTKEGHCSWAQDEVDNITTLHHKLLSEDEEYQKVYKKASPHIDENLKFADGLITNPIQICINGIFGLLLLRTRGKKVDNATKNILDSFGDVLSYLAYKFKEVDKN